MPIQFDATVNPNDQYIALLDDLSGISAVIQLETVQRKETGSLGAFIGGTLGFLIPISSSTVREGIISKIRGTPAEFDKGILAFLKETKLDEFVLGYNPNVSPQERIRAKQVIEKRLADNIVEAGTKQGQEMAWFASYINETGTIKPSFGDDFFNREIQSYTQKLKAEFPAFPNELVVTSPLNQRQRAEYVKNLSAYVYDIQKTNMDLYLDPVFDRISQLHFFIQQHVTYDGRTCNFNFDKMLIDLDQKGHIGQSGIRLTDSARTQARQGLVHEVTANYNSKLRRMPLSFEHAMYMRELQGYLEQHIDPKTGEIRNIASLGEELVQRGRYLKKHPLGNGYSSKTGTKTLLQPTRRAGSVAKVAGGTVLGALAGAGIDYALADNQDYTPDIQVNTNINVEDVFSSALLDNMRQYHSMGTAGAEQMLLSAQTLLDQGYVLEDEIFGSALAYMTEHNCTFSDYAKSDSAHPQVKQVFETLQTTLRTLFEHEEAKALFKEFNLDMNNEELALVVASNMLDGSFYDLLQDVVQQQKDMEQNHESTQNDEYFLSQYGERYVEQEGVTSSLVKDNHSKTV